MAVVTCISWTDHTYNRWIGCSHASPGCRICYAEADQDHRRGRVEWGPAGTRITVSDHTVRQPLLWDAAARRDGIRRRVFCSSLADVFDQHPTIRAAWKVGLWSMIRQTPHLDWLLLTKRPEWVAADVERFAGGTPPPNAWLGFSAENQSWFDRRWAIVRELPFTVRFSSYEPALGPIRLHEEHRGRLHWMIYGGETSVRRNESRPADLQWARDMREDCAMLNVAFWFKQTGNWIDGHWVGKTSATFGAAHNLLDGVVVQQLPSRS